MNTQRGSSLIFAIVALLIIAGITATVFKNNIFEKRMASNYEQNIRSLVIAESGIYAGLQQLQSVVTNQTELDDWFANNSGAVLNNVSFGSGNYSVTVSNNNDNKTITMRSVGTYRHSTRTIDAIIILKNNGAAAALLVNGDLEISGSSDIAGACGAIQVNGLLKKTGSDINVSGGVFATDGIEGENRITAQPIDANAPVVPIPAVVPSDYLALADYILANNGKVYDSNGSEVADTNNSLWNGWEKTGENNGISSWKMSKSTTISNVTLYIEGDVNITASPGSTASPWKISIIAERSIQIHGSPTFTPNNTTATYKDKSNLFLLAGGDIDIKGNVTQVDVEGFIAAHEQLEVSGNAQLLGLVVAENVPTDSGHEDYVSANKITGNALFTQNSCSSSSSGGGNSYLTLWAMVEP